jgi:hypothetical protein
LIHNLESEIKRIKQPRFKQVDIRFLLSQLGQETNYLYAKPCATWDEYDWSNYASLVRKAENLEVAYGLYQNGIKESDKYEVTTKPKYYRSYEEAWIIYAHEFRSNPLTQTNIYMLWVKQSM